jgi:hypothetical protein
MGEMLLPKKTPVTAGIFSLTPAYTAGKFLVCVKKKHIKKGVSSTFHELPIEQRPQEHPFLN